MNAFSSRLMARLMVPVAVTAALSGCMVVPSPSQQPRPNAPAARVPTPVAPVPVVPAPEEPARVAARTVINREMARRLPGVNVAPYTDCVVNNATMAELATLGTAPDPAASVAGIVSRPATTKCIAGLARRA